MLETRRRFTLIVLVLSITSFAQVARGDDPCDVRALLRMTALCCGPRPADGEPVLSLSEGGEAPSPRCTTVSGQAIVPPTASICCPDVQGRSSCCFLPTPWASRPRPAGNWPFHFDTPKDTWFYASLAAFFLLLVSTVLLLWYCCHTAFTRPRGYIRCKTIVLARPMAPPLYGAI